MDEQSEKRWVMACESELRRDARQRQFHRKLWRAFGVLVAAGALIMTCCVRSIRQDMATAPSINEGPPLVTATDAPNGSVAPARPMPAKPFPEQKKSGCRKPQVEINGGCWLALETTPKESPDCGGEDAFEHKGKCYIPVMVPKPFPRSVNP